MTSHTGVVGKEQEVRRDLEAEKLRGDSHACAARYSPKSVSPVSLASMLILRSFVQLSGLCLEAQAHHSYSNTIHVIETLPQCRHSSLRRSWRQTGSNIPRSFVSALRFLEIVVVVDLAIVTGSHAFVFLGLVLSSKQTISVDHNEALCS